VITPRGFTSLQTKEAEYSFSSFIPTNKQTNKLSEEVEYNFSTFIPTNKQTNKNKFHGLVVPLYGTGWDRLDWDRGVSILGGTGGTGTGGSSD